MKELFLGGKKKEKAILHPKQNLFSEKFQLKECSRTGCEVQSLSDEKKRRLNKCNFEGHVLSDPDSKVSFSECDENGVKDVSIVSDQVC